MCSGIEAATVAWHPLGWKPVAFSEIEPFPSAVLAHHYPEVPNVGDMTKYKEWNLGAVDILVGGTPCQSFSVAGLRRGLEDPRGNLALVYCGILDHYRPKWFIWENVPGVLSSGGGRDFGSFLGALAELGYGFAYRVLDAQFFGVAQRRRRVFVVGHLGDWRPAAEVLFESESLRLDTAPSREAGKESAASTRAGAYLGNAEGGSIDVPFMTASSQMRCVNNQPPLIGVSQPITFGMDGDVMGDVMETITTREGNISDTAHAVMQPIAWSEELTASVDLAGTIQRGGDGGRHDGVMTPAMAVRRLTPVECERLQGFPDGYTQIAWRRSPEANCPDGPRYKALGNSMATPVMRWIGERIKQQESKQ